jgi:hypothetical protein
MSPTTRGFAAEQNNQEFIFTLVKGAVAEAVAEAVKDVAEQNFLSPEEREWVRLAIKREARQEQFREKIISSTTVGVIWVLLTSVVGGALLMFKEYAIAHGMWKP